MRGHISVFFLLFVSVSFQDESVLPYITEDELHTKIHSHPRVAVVPLHEKETSPAVDDRFSLLHDVKDTLQRYGIPLYVLDCESSEISICKSRNEDETLTLFRKGEHITDIPITDSTLQQELEANILSALGSAYLTNLSSSSEWRDMMRKFAGLKNIVFFHPTKPPGSLYDYFVDASLRYGHLLQFAYTTDESVAMEVIPHENFIRAQTKVCITLCAESMANQLCPTVPFLQAVTTATMNRTLKALLNPTTHLLGADETVDTLQGFIDDAFFEEQDVIILLAGQGKHDKAERLASMACGLAIGNARCIVITSDAKISRTSANITKNRIHLTILSHEGRDEDRKFGYLLTESPEEIYHQWQSLDAIRRYIREEIRKDEGDDSVLVDSHSDELRREIKYVFDVQDDPVAFAVHNDKTLQDLYLYDFVTIPRLTDVTYDDVINGQAFSVILFTLEFNAKSLAVLSTYVGIHKKLLAEDGRSPLHRVECFDWPDVCAKANYTTYPKMVFYRTNGEKNRVEYNRIWTEAEMIKAIRLYSITWPVVMETEADLQQSSDYGLDVIFGLVTSRTGERLFKEVAMKYGNDYVFIMLKDDAADAFATSHAILRGNNDLLLGLSKGQLLSLRHPFVTIEDITQFMNLAFQNDCLIELTTSNYQSLISDPLPLFIYYRNPQTTASDKQLLDYLRHLASDQYVTKAVFAWMDSSPGSTGQYSLHLHSGDKFTDRGLVYFSKKGSTSVKSLTENTEAAELQEWIKSCLDGKAPLSFELLDGDLKPRLPGHDFLRYMKEQGLISDDDQARDNDRPSTRKVKTARHPFLRKPFVEEPGNVAEQPIQHTEL